MNDKIIESEGKQFRPACDSAELREGSGINIESEDPLAPDYALFRHNNELYCFENNCPHKHSAKLHKGYLSGGELSCPLHGWTFSLRGGANLTEKGGKGLNEVDVIESEGIIYIEEREGQRPGWAL
jgi:nitrite reductase/ring-hydroxylating ferredoxin subunit